MPVTVDVTVSDSCAADSHPELALLEQWVSAAYLDDVTAVASILVTSAEKIQQLNKQYRDKDKATNVLSFPMESPDDVDISLLGDIVLCTTVIKQEAEQQAKSEESHWAHMVVHAMLHLQGFDHIDNDEAEKMEQLEIKILQQLGFDNPYLYPDTDETR